MDEEIFNDSLADIEEKLGDDYAKITGEIGVLKTAQKEAQENFAKTQKQIDSMKKDYAILQKANAKLLQQIPTFDNKETDDKEEEEEKPKEVFDPMSVFNNGRLS